MTATVVQDVNPRLQYIAASNQTVYTFTFPIYAPTDISVYSRPAGSIADDITNILTYNVGYTVTLNTPGTNGGPSIGGSITLTTASNAGDIVTLVRSQPDQRLNYYLQGGLFSSPMVNSDFDQDVLMIQQNTMYNTAVTPHYNLNDTIDPIIDIYLPYLPPNSVWVKNGNNTAIVAMPYNNGGGGGGGSVTSVGLVSSTLTISGSPITSSGNITANLPVTGVAAGSYTNTNLTVDAYGRITNAANGSGSSGGSAITLTVNQAAHGFTLDQIVYWTGSTYALAQADTVGDAEVIGMVTTVVNVNSFIMTICGYVPTANTLSLGINFLSDITAGALTTSPPTTPGHIEKPLFNAITTTSGFFFNWRGKIIPAPEPTPGTWQTVSTATQMVSGVNYIVNSGTVAFTLPTTAAVGDIMEIAGYNNTWSVAQNAGQQIQFGIKQTTLGASGSLASTLMGDCIRLLCTVANTNWLALGDMGNITFV